MYLGFDTVTSDLLILRLHGKNLLGYEGLNSDYTSSDYCLSSSLLYQLPKTIFNMLKPILCFSVMCVIKLLNTCPIFLFCICHASYLYLCSVLCYMSTAVVSIICVRLPHCSERYLLTYEASVIRTTRKNATRHS